MKLYLRLGSIIMENVTGASVVINIISFWSVLYPQHLKKKENYDKA